VIDLHVRNEWQDAGGKAKNRANGLQPELCASECSDHVEQHDDDDALHRSRKGAEIQRSRVIFLPCAQVKVSER